MLVIFQDYDIRPLVAAVILQAMRQAKHAPEARQWLLTDAPLWFDALGLELQPEQVRRWIARGCKITARGGLHLGA